MIKYFFNVPTRRYMIKTIYVAIVLLVSFSAFAGVGFQLEHPRHPSGQKDHYIIKCEKLCSLEIQTPESIKGEAAAGILEEKVRELMKLHKNGLFPKDLPSSQNKVLYKIKLDDGVTQFESTLGYPESYQAQEFTKFSKIISLVEEIKRLMKLELLRKK